MDSEVLTDSVLRRDEVRPPPKAVTLLLPVWGYRFVSQCLDFCLPTLLAPGNLPAVAALLPTRFVVLSREDDEELIRSHPTWLALEQVCAADVEAIDDLITDGNHTTTITLAFARAVRQAQAAMTETCFVFLMSDYLFADGSLRTLVQQFLKGASAVVAGNFQVIAEEASPPYGIDPDSRALTLPGRDLLAWSLGYLHPATIANVVNFGLSHNAHTNRLLWRVDENTLIGRFYLIHPIGIRPEVADFVVGSSLDYSFVPEMCPSGNVVTLTDSDDYFVVEMQPRHHESANLRAGPLQEADLADSLSEWTTAQHRANAAQTVVYHAAEIPPNLADAIADADAFIDRVARLLAPVPQPHRNHPYWIGAIASNRLQTGQALSNEDWRFLLGESIPSAGLRGLTWRLRRKIFGVVPDVTRLHTRWPDYNLPLKALQQVLAENGGLLLVTDRPISFAHWLAGSTRNVSTIEWDRLFRSQLDRLPAGMPEWYRHLIDSYDACLVVVTEPMLQSAGKAIELLGPLLKETAQIAIMVINDRPYRNAALFRQVFAQSSADLISRAAWKLEVHYVSATRLRWLIYRASDSVLRRLRGAYQGSMIMLPVWGTALISLGIITFFANLRVRSTATPPQGLWSSVFLMLSRSRREGEPARYVPDLARPVLRTSGDQARNPPQGADDVGRAVLQPATDLAKGKPSSLLLAHDVAAKLLAGRHDVAVYGLDEADDAQVALYNVKRLAAIYDPVRGSESRRHSASGPPHQVKFHDILAGPLPRSYDSLISLGTLTYISAQDEDFYFRNLAASLSRSQNILVVGCGTGRGDDGSVSAQSGQPWSDKSGAAAGRAPRAGAAAPSNEIPAERKFYSRTGPQLKALAERFFYNVFLFSIADGVMHPGALSSADYILVACCSRKI